MKVQDLPNEILQQILQFLPHHTLYQCIFVCKAWSSLASEEYLKELLLDEKRGTFLAPILRFPPPPDNTSSQVIRQWTKVQTLKVTNYASSTFTQDQRFLFLSQLPSLQKIELTYDSAYFFLRGLDTLFTTSDAVNTRIMKQLQETLIPIDRLDYPLLHINQNVCYKLCKGLLYLHLIKSSFNTIALNVN
jgi:hypothetical protein